MQVIRLFSVAIFIGLAALGLLTTATEAAILNVDANGQLRGARNVEIGGSLFDVTFVDGTCFDAFGNCEQQDFDFSAQTSPFLTTSSVIIISPNPPNATAANQAAGALLEQVLINTSAGAFDSQPELTHGCTDGLVCEIIIPVLRNPDEVAAAFASNQSGDSLDFSSLSLATLSLVDNTVVFGSGVALSDSQFTFARFSPSAKVSEPTALAIFSLGLFGVSVCARRKSSCTRASSNRDLSCSVKPSAYPHRTSAGTSRS